jgi:alpha-1,3/alpha-1,6-mannosyltransferase
MFCSRYTPTNEHFGIVPLEAMNAGVPVLATDTGGPTESVVHKMTGWLLPSDGASDASGAWSAVMVEAAGNARMCAEMGKNGR